MTRIVRTHYRYKRPPRKRKVVALEVPAIVTISDKTRRRVSDRPAAEAPADPAPPPVAPDVVSETRLRHDDRKPAIVRAKKPRTGSLAEPVEPKIAPPANDDRKSAIVTARRPGKARSIPAGWLPETEEEHRRVGDLADAMFREMKRAIAERLRK